MDCLGGLIEKPFYILISQLLKQLLVTAIPIFPLTLSDKDEQSIQKEFLWRMGWLCPHSQQQSSFSGYQHSFSFPRRALKDTLHHCAPFRLLRILVGAETEEGEEVV